MSTPLYGTPPTTFTFGMFLHKTLEARTTVSKFHLNFQCHQLSFVWFCRILKIYILKQYNNVLLLNIFIRYLHIDNVYTKYVYILMFYLASVVLMHIQIPYRRTCTLPQITIFNIIHVSLVTMAAVLFEMKILYHCWI